MDWRIDFDHTERIARIVASGDFLVEDCTESILATLASDFWQPGTNVLCDFRDTTIMGINLDRLRILSTYHEKRNMEIGSGKIALLMGSPRDFGFARQYEMVSEGVVISKVAVFLEYEKAIEWLKAT